MTNETRYMDLVLKVQESLGQHKLSEEMTEDEKKVYPLYNYDYSKEEQKKDANCDCLDFHYDVVRTALRPENPQDLPELTIIDVRSHDYSDITGCQFSIYANGFIENGEVYLPLETPGYPNFMVRKWKPNKETLEHLRAEFGPDVTTWHENMDNDKPYGFDAIRIFLRVDNGVINGYTERDIQRIEAEETPDTPNCTS